MYNKYNDVLKGRILMLFDQGKTNKEIIQILKIPKSTVSTLLKKYRERSHFDRNSGSGRPKLLERKAVSRILKEKRLNKKASAPFLQKKLMEKESINVRMQTIRNTLKDNRLYACSPAVVQI